MPNYRNCKVWYCPPKVKVPVINNSTIHRNVSTKIKNAQRLATGKKLR